MDTIPSALMFGGKSLKYAKHMYLLHYIKTCNKTHSTVTALNCIMPIKTIQTFIVL